MALVDPPLYWRPTQNPAKLRPTARKGEGRQFIDARMQPSNFTPEVRLSLGLTRSITAIRSHTDAILYLLKYTFTDAVDIHDVLDLRELTVVLMIGDD